MNKIKADIDWVLERNYSRRKAISWSTPIIISCAIPAHASLTCLDGPMPPNFSIGTEPKCSGDPPVGTAEFRLEPADSLPVIIKSIKIQSEDPKNSVLVFEELPREIIPGEWQSVFWVGAAGDAVSCFPLTTVLIVIEYCCPGGQTFTASYDILSELVFR